MVDYRHMLLLSDTGRVNYAECRTFEYVNQCEPNKGNTTALVVKLRYKAAISLPLKIQNTYEMFAHSPTLLVLKVCITPAAFDNAGRRNMAIQP